jgi:SP family sugar:H+ symporter-like MFS transporter
VILCGAVGVCACEFVIAIANVTSTSQIPNKVPIAFVCLYIFFFACSWGPVGWIVVGEVFPLEPRAKSVACPSPVIGFSIEHRLRYAIMVDNRSGK